MALRSLLRACVFLLFRVWSFRIYGDNFDLQGFSCLGFRVLGLIEFIVIGVRAFGFSSDNFEHKPLLSVGQHSLIHEVVKGFGNLRKVYAVGLGCTYKLAYIM